MHVKHDLSYRHSHIARSNMKIQIVCIGCLVGVTLYHCFNLFQSKRGSKRNQNIDRNNWQIPPHDIMEMILLRLNLGDRIRLSVVCKSWQSIAMRRDIRCPPQLPWLVVSDGDYFSNFNNYLNFFSLSDGKVGKLTLPKPVQGGWFRGSSHGWLIIVQEKGLNSEIFLFNPISGVQHQLPSLRTIPSFHEFVKTTDWERFGAYSFCDQVALSTSDINSQDCMVAAAFGYGLSLCRPGDKTWSVFQVIDDHDQEQRIDDIFFSSSGILYALVAVEDVSNDMNGVVVSARNLSFADHALQLKLIYSKRDYVGNAPSIEHHDDYIIQLNVVYSSYFLESTTSNEVLVIQKLTDIFVKIVNDDDDDDDDDDDVYEGNDGNEEGNNVEGNINEDGGEAGNELEDMEFDTSYERTATLKVFKVDPETGNCLIAVHNLGEELLFLADSGAFSLPASDYKELQRNCIYFAANNYMGHRFLKPYICREIGVFDLTTKRIKRSFPSVILSKRSKLAWFLPSLW